MRLQIVLLGALASVLAASRSPIERPAPAPAPVTQATATTNRATAPPTAATQTNVATNTSATEIAQPKPAPGTTNQPPAPAVTNSAPETATNVEATANQSSTTASTNEAASAVTPTTHAVAVTNETNVATTNSVPATHSPPTAAGAAADPHATNEDANIRFDFAGMPYMDAVRRFAQMAGKPLVADTNIEGTLTFSDPRPYTYDEALDALNLVLSTKDATLIQDGRYLRLVPFKELPQMPIRILHGFEHADGIRPGQIVTVVMQLKNLDANEIAQPISSMLSAAGSVAPLSRGRGLIVTGRMENIQRVRQLLNQIDTASPVQREVKTFTLHNASGTLLAMLINRTFGVATAPRHTVYNAHTKRYQVLPPDPSDYVTAVFADASNTLVLFGPAGRIALAEQLIKKFETEAGAHASEIKIFYPQMPVEQLARLVQEAIPGVARRGERGRRSAVMAKVIPDPTSNRLIVTAPAAGQLDAITKLINRLDPTTQETPPIKAGGHRGTGPKRELRVVDVKSGSARALAPLLRVALTELSRNQKKTSPLARVRVQAAPMGSRLLLVGESKALDQVTRLIAQLDHGTSEQIETHVFKLHNADARVVANMIMRAMGSYRFRRRGGSFVAAAAEERSNCVIVAGSADEMKLITNVIKQIETIGGSSSRQLKILQLTNSSARQVASALYHLLGPEMYSRQTSQRVALTPTPDDHALVVEANEQMMSRLEQAVWAMDAEGKTGGFEMRVVNVKSGSAQVLAPMLSRTLRELGRNGSGAASLGDVRVEASPTGSRLLLTGPKEALNRVTNLVAQLDTVQTNQAARIFKLQNADARQVASMLMRAMGSYNWRDRGAGRVIAAADSQSNSLIVSAPEGKMKLVEQVIKQIETVGSTSGRELKILQLTNSSANELSRTMFRLFGRQMYSRNPGQRVSLAPAPNDHALIVEAGQEMMSRIEQAVWSLDAEGKNIGIEMRVVDVKSGSAEALAPMLSQTLRELGRNGSTAGPLALVHVQASPMGNRLLLAGPKTALDRVTNLVAQLDTVQTNQAARVFKLKNADARQVAQMISRAMNSYNRGRRGAGNVVAAAEERSNCVIVSAPEAQMKLVADVIKQLEAAGSADGQQLAVLPVNKNSAASIAAMLTQLFFPEIRSFNSAQHIAITASPDDHAVVVEAGASMMARVQQAVKALDVEPTRAAMEVRTYSLPAGSSGNLVQSLDRIFAGPQQQRRYGRYRFGMRGANQPPAPRFEFDSASGTLMVAATADEFPEIEKVLTKLQSAAAVSSEVQTFRLQYGDPTQVADLLQSILIGQGRQPWRGFRGWRGGSGSSVVKVAAAPALNAVVVQAPPDKLAVASELIKTLDTSNGSGVGTIQAVQVQNANADAVATAVMRTLSAKSGRNSRPAVSVTAVPGSHSLLVNGPPAEVVKVIQLIHTVDKTSTSNQLQTRVFELKNGEAQDLARVLTQLLRGIARSQPSFARRYSSSTFTVTADKRTNSLIVSATPEYFKVIEQLLPTLDQAPQHSDRQMQIYWLENAYADDVALKLKAFFQDRPRNERPTIEADDIANSVTAVAKPGDLVEINDMVQKLDQTARDTSLQIRMIPLDQIPVERMASMLTNIYSQMNQGSIKVVNRLPKLPVGTNVEAAPNAAPAAITNVLTTTQATTNGVASAASTATQTTTNAVVSAPPVTIAMDKSANALIVSGPAYELDHIESLVDQLSSSYNSPEFEIRRYPLKEADPVVVARVLNELFKPQPVPGRRPPNFRGSQQQRGRGGRYRNGNEGARQGRPNQRPGQRGQVQPSLPEVTVVPESRTHSVIIRARPNDFTLLESIIKQLDQNELSSQLAHRLVPLQHVTPERILPLIQQMLRQIHAVRPGEPVVVASDPSRRALFLVGRDSVLTDIENLVHELDTPSSFSEIELKVFPLQNAEAAELATLLRSVLQPENARNLSRQERQMQQQISQLKFKDENGKPIQLDLTQPIKIVADPPQPTSIGGANRLIIGSTPENLKALTSIVKLLDTVPLAEGLTATLVRLQHVNASLVAQALDAMFQSGTGGSRGGRRGRFGRGGASSSALNVGIDARNNLLILSGRKETLARAEEVIQKLDTAAGAGAESIRIFPLQHADAASVLQVLTDLGRGRGARRMNPNEQPTLSVDERSNAVIAFGSKEALDFVAKLVKQLDQPLPTDLNGIRIITLQNADAASIAASLQRLLDERMRMRGGRRGGGAMRTVVIADPRSNSLLISGSPESYQLVQDLVKQLDQPGMSLASQIRLVPLKYADAQTLATTLSQLFTRRAQSLRTRGSRPNRPVILADPRSNSLLVAASVDDNRALNDLLKKLDRKPESPSVQLTVIGLQYNDATRMAVTLRSIFQARLRSMTPQGQRPSPSDEVNVQGDALSNALVVSGNKQNLELVRNLVKQLDTPNTSLTGQVRLIPLQHADALTLATTLTQLFNERYQAARMAGGQRNRPVILADPRSNSLLVAASDTDNQVLDSLIQKLDREPENPALQLTVIGLKYNDATRMSATLRSIFAARLQSLTPPNQRPSPADRVDVQPDTMSNSLVVSANKKNLELIHKLVAKLDSEPVPTGGILQAFTLHYADVQRVANMLQSLVQQGVYRPGLSAAGGRRNPNDALAVAADPLSNTLIVSASPANMAIVKELIKQLDTPQYNASSDIKLYPLKHARASYLATVLRQFFQAKQAGETTRGGGQRPVPVTVTPDERTNTLLITGSKESFAAVDRIVAQLDSEKTMPETNFRVFALKNATATTLQSTLQRLFANRPAPQGQPRQPVTIIADGWANALIVGGSEDDLQMAASLIDQLDKPQPNGGPQVQVFQLAKADAQRVAQTLQSLFRSAAGGPGGAAGGSASVMINVDQRMNAIVVSAGAADLKRIATLVKKLDTSELARVAEIRIFPLKNAQATQLASILNNVLNTNAKSLTQASPNRQSLLQFITRTKKGRQLITSALKEGVIIVADPSSNALVVSAPVDYMGLLSQIIESLDDTAPTMANIRIFNLKNADARQMALVLESLFHLQSNGRYANTPTGNEQTVRYTMPKQAAGKGKVTTQPTTDSDQSGAAVGSAEEASLTVTVDLRTNSLLIGGTEHYVELASQIIETLDSTPAQERQTAVYRLKNSQAMPVETALRTFLQQDLQTMLSILGPSGVGTAQNILDREVSIVAETNDNCLLISASPRYFSDVMSLVTNLDQPQPQVLIQVLLAEVTLNSNEGMGVEWNYKTKGTPSVATGTDMGAQQLGKQLGFGGFSSALTGGNYGFLITALERQDRLEVLSRPQILTADNQQATINIGQQVPIVNNAVVTPQGGTMNQFAYTNIGVMLTVTPRISPDGYVQMVVNPSVSDLSQSTVEVSPGFNAPIINERTATTTVTVKSGDSVLIGGLISTSDDIVTNKVPLLGDIPGLGALFRNRTVTKQRQELLVILTPQILLKGQGRGTQIDASAYTGEELRQSGFKKKMHLDALQRHLLDQVYPPPTTTTNSPSVAPVKAPTTTPKVKMMTP